MSSNQSSQPPSHLHPPPIVRAQSHQSGTITNHWNDLPAGYIPSPSSGTSRSASRNSNTLGSGAAATRDASPSPLKALTGEPTATAGGDSEADLKPLDVLLPALYNLPTVLPQNERNMLQTRINKSLLPTKGDGGVSDAQRMWIRELLHGFIVEGRAQKEVREEIVAFMRRESGVAGWAGSVRKVVESAVEPVAG